MKQKPKKGELLFEIGTEEIPSSYLASLGTTNHLTELTKTLLREAFLDAASDANVESYQTPCRIVISVRDLPLNFSKEDEIIGPKKEFCYTPDGKPTPALEGFLRSKQATLKELAEEGGRVVIRRSRRKSTRDALKEALPRLVPLLAFPKMMRWNDGDLRFPRPIRWILCLYNGEVLPLKQGLLTADRKTYGVRPDRMQKRVRDFEDYFAFLKKEGILLEGCTAAYGGRKQFIRHRLQKELQKLAGFSETLNESLLDEVTNLVEKPVLFSGHFDKKYLKLPKEVLVASLSKYQRLFSVENRKGELLSCFIACANGSPSLAKTRKNYEYVLNARLEDADFFFEEDTKESFSQKRERLKFLIYHQALGTMYDKSERMKKMAEHVTRKGLNVEAKSLLRACELAKNDLVTEMVKEFPSLQGVVGCYYAKRSGETETVALALREQYLDLPKSSVGCALAFLEKLDHVVGCFYAGETPTGSSDPYGLRRAANDFFKILLNQRWKFSLEEVIQANAELFDKGLSTRKERKERLLSFLKERLKGIFKEEGFREDLLEAVVTDRDEPIEMHEKLSALREMMEKRPDDFLAAFKVVERTHNILKPVSSKEKEGIGMVQPNLFQDEIEKNLWTTYNNKKDSIERLIGEEAWAEATVQYGASFSEKLHHFFEKVLVNVENPDVRRNRLAMMKEINELYTKPIADLSKLMMNQ